MGAMSDWRSFWDSAHSIYVNARHKDVHYREIADQIAAFVPGPAAREHSARAHRRLAATADRAQPWRGEPVIFPNV